MVSFFVYPESASVEGVLTSQVSARMAEQYTRSQLRDVLVEFYSRVDPARLDAGIDINGMIDWIVYHGPDDMNARLMAKYGQGLNFDILKQPKATNQSALHRISMMPNTQLIEQQQKRLELRAKVEAFYKENDPDKLATVDTFVEWIEVNGEKAFNDLLMKKYGKTMGLATRAKPTPPTPPAVLQQAPPTPAPAPVASATKPAPPTLPPRQNTAPSGPDPALIDKLNRFYSLHEPDQPNDPLPIAEWASQVGLTVLNEKLMQLYGGSLDTLEDDEKRALEPPPPPPEDDDFPPPPPPQEESQPDEPEPEPEPEVPEMTMPEPPKPPQPPVITMPEPPKPPQLPVLEPPKPRFVEPPKKPEPPKLVPKPMTAPPKAPEAPKFVPKPGTTAPLPQVPVFRSQGGPTMQKPTPPQAPMIAKPQTIQAAVAVQATKPPPPGGKGRKRRPSEGACDRYVLDLSGDGFGVCVCGFNRAAHNQPKISGTERRSIKVKSPVGKQERPCINYRVDVSGKNFGDCLCGWSKGDHNKIDWHPPLENKAPIAPPTPKVADVDPNSIVEMVFDQATTTVFNMMVESYVEQHGEEPDEETKVDWASNLAILSVGKDFSHGTKLRIRAKALPKKKN